MPLKDLNVIVYGPAYLDVVIRVNAPLVSPGLPPIDNGGNAVIDHDWNPRHEDLLEVQDCYGNQLRIRNIQDTSLRHRYQMISRGFDFTDRDLHATEIIEDLGGMGAGYAKLLDAQLVSALPLNICVLRNRIEEAIALYRIQHTPLLIDETSADWTLLISSGQHGDKLPIGLRGCHERLSFEMIPDISEKTDVVISASLKNELMLEILKKHEGSVRFLAPALRNCISKEGSVSISSLAPFVDIMTLNEMEWNAMSDHDREIWVDADSILCITRGPRGADISWRGLNGMRKMHHEPAFPRIVEPVDTNRAGEAFGGFLLKHLEATEWFKYGTKRSECNMAYASKYASVAAGLTIQKAKFGFPSHFEIESALLRGYIK